jgi:hypothetical protein
VLQTKKTQKQVIRLKSLFFLTSLTCILYSSCGFCQEIETQPTSTTRTSYGVVPILSFDADLGLRIGGVFNYFKYKDSLTEFPNENLFIRTFGTTRKSFQFQSVYETSNLSKYFKTIFELSIINDKAYDFWGLNGVQSQVDPLHEDIESADFIHESYYNLHKTLYRFRADIHIPIYKKNTKALLGFSINHVGHQLANDSNNLYAHYHNNALFNSTHLNGGNSNYLNIGLIHDTRNNPNYSSKGVWAEAFFVLNPSIINETSFSKLILNFRNYAPLFHSKWVLMSRASVQVKTSGEIPIYMKPIYFDSRLNQDGLGGAFNLRGFRRNRIVADGFALLNLELRRPVLDFKWKKTPLIVDLSLFSDHAKILQEHPLNLNAATATFIDLHIDTPSSIIYSTIGLGAYLTINKSSVVSMNYGIPLNKNFRTGALYIGSSFLF